MGKENHGVAYIYFEYKEQERQTPIRVLASLCKQLAVQTPKLPTEIEKLYDGMAHSKKRPTFEVLFTILTIIFKSFDQVSLVFDGLDECDVETQRIGEFGLLSLIRRMGEIGANIFVTSRPHPEDIQEAFGESAKIELLAKEKDIAAYLQQKIDEKPRVKRMVQQANYQDKIIPELVGLSRGM